MLFLKKNRILPNHTLRSVRRRILECVTFAQDSGSGGHSKHPGKSNPSTQQKVTDKTNTRTFDTFHIIHCYLFQISS